MEDVHCTYCVHRDKLGQELMPEPKNSGTEYLVGGIRTPLKKMKVSWDDYSQNMENQTFSKPLS